SIEWSGAQRSASHQGNFGSWVAPRRPIMPGCSPAGRMNHQGPERNGMEPRDSARPRRPRCAVVPILPVLAPFLGGLSPPGPGRRDPSPAAEGRVSGETPAGDDSHPLPVPPRAREIEIEEILRISQAAHRIGPALLEVGKPGVASGTAFVISRKR